MKISLCMIVKDEQDNIINCLDRALKIVDEAIIVDTGSVDKTKQLLKENYGSDDRVKLVKYIWENDFSKARNESLKYATGDWILVLDADERLFSDRQKIEEFLKKKSKKAFIIPIYNVLDGKNISITSTMIRLFKNENPKYKGAIHEQIEIDGESFVPSIIDGDICKIYHYGYTKTLFKEKNKQNRNMDIINTEIEKAPKNPFNWYNKGVMEMIQDNYEIAIDDFLKSHKLTNKKRMGFHNDLILRVIQCMMILKKYKQVIKFIKEVSNDSYIKKIPDIYYYCGLAYFNIKKYPLAINYFKKAIETGEYEKGTSKFGIGSFFPKLGWAKVLILQNKKELAIEKFKEAVFDENNVNKQGLDELKCLLKQENLTDELNKLEIFMKEKENKNSKVTSKSDFEKYKIEVKENIKKLVENGILEEAKKLINEYEQLVKKDADIYSIKGIIAMMKGDMDEAFTVINKGLSINSKHIDLLYNKAYLLEQIKEYKASYKLYKQVFNYTNDLAFKEEIENKLNEIKEIDSSVEFGGKLSILTIDKRVSKDICNFISNWVYEFGFTILKTIDTRNVILNKNEIKQCLIMYDLNSKQIEGENKKIYPDIDNERYFLIRALQKQLSIEFSIKNSSDYLYLTKNEVEAKSLANKLLQSEIEELYENIQKIEETYKTQYPVVKLFNGFRHRAKTELIHYRDGLAVKKTWKPGNKKFIEREKFACSELSKKISYIPPLLESGENYIIIPYYENILQNDKIKKRILTTYIVDIATFLKELYNNGYFNPDIHPGQFVFSEEEGLKAIDFEYLQSYEKKPSLFIESYDIQGYPKNFKGDKPNYIGQNLHSWYNDLWVKYTGYTLNQIANLMIDGKYNNDDPEINKVLGLLNYAKTSGKSYDGSSYRSAYHSLKLKKYYFRGQRECNLRLQKVPYDFSGKTVLDIGCNAGGMLYALANKIKIGIGIDYDYRLINAANAIKTINQSNNLSFYRFDLENEELNLIQNYILSEDGKVDICFLLSVCMWIKNWEKVIEFVVSITNNLLFETNGTYQQQLAQTEELKKYYENIEIIEEESNDDPGQPNRRLLFCRKKIKGKTVIHSNMLEYDKMLDTIIKPECDVIYKQSISSHKICKIYEEDDKNNEIDFKEYMQDFFDLEFYRNYFNLINNKDKIKGIITGLSYFEVGIEPNKLKLPFVNLALSSQDLFYDFAMLKYVIDDLNNSKNVEQVIIGLSNYSFRYDLSMTQNPQTREKPKVYYFILKNLHNYSSKCEVIDKYNMFEKQFNHLFQKGYLFKIYQYWGNRFNTSWDNMLNLKFDFQTLTKEKKQREIYLAKRWNESYSDTVEENIKIFRKMLKYLKDRNIKIVVVTNPVTDFYKNYFPRNCREEFMNIIRKFEKEFDFVFIDGYNMNCFNDNDFYDASHLNRMGATKFTEIINKICL